MFLYSNQTVRLTLGANVYLSVQRMRALFDFVPQEDEELGFKKDDIIEVIAQEEENWWRGSCNGRTGLFPHTYCQPIS